MPEKVFRGRTEDAAAPFLGAEFWTEGKKILAVVDREFDVEDRKCYTLRVLTPVEVDGVECAMVSMDTTAGLKMALQAAGLPRLLAGDKVFLTCTGKEPPKKQGNSPRTNFEIEVTRTW